jgi:hypothetical protein
MPQKHGIEYDTDIMPSPGDMPHPVCEMPGMSPGADPAGIGHKHTGDKNSVVWGSVPPSPPKGGSGGGLPFGG